MKIYNNLIINKKYQNSVIAIGNFDGIHLGHQKVINQAKQKAKKINYHLELLLLSLYQLCFLIKKLRVIELIH